MTGLSAKARSGLGIERLMATARLAAKLDFSSIPWAQRGREMGTEWAQNKNAHMKWAFAVSGNRSLFGCAGKI